MSEVSTKTIIAAAGFLESRGFERAAVFNTEKFPGLAAEDLDPVFLFNPQKMVSWTTFVKVLDGLYPYFPDDDSIEAFVKWSFASKAEWIEAFSPVAHLFNRPSELYQIIEWGTKILFANVEVKTTVKSRREVECRMWVESGEVPSLLFFRFTLAFLRHLPRLVGYNPAKVTMATEGNSAVYNIAIPAAGLSIYRAFVFQTVRALFQTKTLIDHMKKSHDEFRKQLSDIVKSRGELKSEIVNRTNELATANVQLTTLMENSPDIILTTNRKKTITYINKTNGSFLREDVIGNCCLDFVRDDFREAYSKILDAALLEGKTGTIDLPVADNTFWLTRVVPILERGVVKELLIICSDLTAEKHSADRLEQAHDIAVGASRTKNAFLANISHEIRSPLTSIIGFGEILASDTSNMTRDQVMSCERMLINSRYLLNLVNDVLDIAKIEAGTVTLMSELFRVEDVIEDIIKMFAVQATGKALNLVNRTQNLRKILLRGDTQRLRQILINLVGNAIKFTEAGEVAIEATLLPAKVSSQVLLRIDVCDTGYGIDPEKAGFLFEPFQQGEIFNGKKQQGTGLGLFLSRHIARMMSGDITLVYSKPGVGTRFSIQIEFESAVSLAEMQNEQQKAIVVKGKGEHILIAEDNLDQCYLIQTRLEQNGYQPVIVHNGVAALKMLRKSKPALVILDLQMPEKDGYAVCRELRQFDVRTPVIALSAHASQRERDLCFSLGFTDCWSKPISTENLLNGIAKALETN